MKAKVKAVAVTFRNTPQYEMEHGWSETEPSFLFDIEANGRRYGIQMPVNLNLVIDDEEHIQKYSVLYARKACECFMKYYKQDVNLQDLYDVAYRELPTMFRKAVDLEFYRKVFTDKTTEI